MKTMPMLIKDRAICPYCGNGIVEYPERGIPTCDECKEEFGVIMNTDENGNTEIFMGDKQHIIESFFNQFMNEPVRNVDDYALEDTDLTES